MLHVIISDHLCVHNMWQRFNIVISGMPVSSVSGNQPVYMDIGLDSDVLEDIIKNKGILIMIKSSISQ